MGIKEKFEWVKKCVGNQKNEKDKEYVILQIDALAELVFTTIHRYKSKIGGYSKSNGECLKKIEKLNEELVQTKSELKDALSLPNKLNEDMHEEINHLHRDLSLANSNVSALKTAVKKLTDEKNDAEKKLAEFKSLPWYRRIFVK